jgi:AcrR family transcriptional regulator
MPQSHKVGVMKCASFGCAVSRAAATGSSIADDEIPRVVPALLCPNAASTELFIDAAARSTQAFIQTGFDTRFGFLVNDSRFGPAFGSPLPQDERAQEILGAALVAFGENGYANTRLTDIARRAGVSTSTVLRYFSSKDEIFREVVRSTLLGILTMRDDAAVPAEEPSAADAVRTLARQYWTTMERPELVAIVRLAIGELPRFPELAVFHATEALERFVRTLERIIEGGISRGELRPVDARAAARTILATLAAHALWFAYPGIYAGITGRDRERAVATTIETLIQTLGPVAKTTQLAASSDEP